MRQTALVMILLAAVLPASCELFGDESTGRISDLERHRRQWERQGIDTYEYDLTVSCFCAFRGPVRVLVRSGAVHSVTEIETGVPVEETFSFVFKTIDDLFDVIADAVERKADRLDVQYDESLGYPTLIAIDYSVNVADEEITYRVANLHPLR